MADDLISRQAAQEAVKYIPWCDWKAVGDCLDKLPVSDAVEVVRCSECIHRGKDSWCAYVDEDADFFCKRGERRGRK